MLLLLPLSPPPPLNTYREERTKERLEENITRNKRAWRGRERGERGEGGREGEGERKRGMFNVPDPVVSRFSELTDFFFTSDLDETRAVLYLVCGPNKMVV